MMNPKMEKQKQTQQKIINGETLKHANEHYMPMNILVACLFLFFLRTWLRRGCMQKLGNSSQKLLMRSMLFKATCKSSFQALPGS